MITRLTPFALALAFVSGAGAGAASFTDAAGDSGTAPDVVKVDVRNTAANDVVLTVRFANRPTWSGLLQVYLDTGADQAAEYYLELNAQSQWNLARWTGAGYEPVAADGIDVTYANGEAEFTFNARHIGGATTFAFSVLAREGSAEDEAPAAPASWRFELTPPRVTRSTATFAPATPRAGARFSVSRVSLQLDGVAREPARTFACRATLAGKQLRAARRCSWLLPKNARGKLLTVGVTANGLLVTKRFRVR